VKGKLLMTRSRFSWRCRWRYLREYGTVKFRVRKKERSSFAKDEYSLDELISQLGKSRYRKAITTRRGENRKDNHFG